MTTKEYLQQVHDFYFAADSKTEQLAKLQALAQSTTRIMQNSLSANNTQLSSRIESAVAQIEEQSFELAEEIKNMTAAHKDIAATIAQIKNPTEKCLLEYRYLAFLPWKEIAFKLKIQIKSIYRMHDSALKSFEAIREQNAG